MNEIIDTLLCCELFRGIGKAGIQHMLLTMKYRIQEFDKNERICRADQHADAIGVIISGQIEIQKNLPSGNVICMLYKNRGDAFGGSVALSSSAVYPCDIIAGKHSRMLFLDTQSIFSLCENPTFAKNMIASFANRVLYYEKRLELLSYSSIQSKIAFYLLNEQKLTGDSTVKLLFSKKKWAEYLNVSRPSLCRELKKLCDDGVLEATENRILMCDKDYLIGLLS